MKRKSGFSFLVHDILQRFSFWFYRKKINLIIYYDKTLNYLENDRFSVSSENELNMDYDINRMKRLIICFAENYTFLFFGALMTLIKGIFPL